MNNTDQIIVVTEEKKRRKGLIWLAAGTAALVAGGGIFALWSANDEFAGGVVTAGDLNIEQKSDTVWWDVSADRTDATEDVAGSIKGHEIADIEEWMIVPGDKIAADYAATVTLLGDNLVASLSLDGMDANELENMGMTYTYAVYYGDKEVIAETALPTGADSKLMNLAAPVTGQNNGLQEEDAVELGASAVAGADAAETIFAMPEDVESVDLQVLIFGAFDSETTERDEVKAVDTLAKSTLKLQQVRVNPDNGGNFK